jgi:nucleotide-binding universal stress UspA family protein
MATLSWSSSARVVHPVDGDWRPWRRNWIRSAFQARETVLVTRRNTISSVLCVEDGSLRLRRWLHRLIATEAIGRVRCLGVVDVSVPWYAGVGFSPTELGEALELAAIDASRTLDRSTRAMALWLERRGIPAVAERCDGSFAQTVLRRASETDADLILVCEDRPLRSELRTIVERAACSVLVVRDAPSGAIDRLRAS